MTETTPSLPDLPGTLAARYEAERVLGEGGYGTVILARDRELERRVAVKLLRGTLDDPELVARFERNSRRLATVAVRSR